MQKLSWLEGRHTPLWRKVNGVNMLAVIGNTLNATAHFLRDWH
jgi:hypothetical protein